MLISTNKETIYDLVIVTDRNYGLYAGFAHGILGLKVLILEYFFTATKKKTYELEGKIWKEETKEDYLVGINKLKIPVLPINNFFYNYNNITDSLHITYTSHEIDNKVFSKNILYGLSENHHLLPKVKLNIINEAIVFEFNKNLYVLGEKALYDGKIFAQDIYTGEGNLIAQSIYQKLHNSKENITVHSTDLL